MTSAQILWVGFWLALYTTLHPLTSFQVWTVSLPLVILNSPAVSDLSRGGSNPDFGTARDILGIILWGIGWLIEAVADAQKVIL